MDKDKVDNSIILKFEFSGQPYELKSLTSDDSVADLKAVICSLLNIDNKNKITLKTLHPTRIISASDDSKKLSELFRQKRERIIVERAVFVDTTAIDDDSTTEEYLSDASPTRGLKTERQSSSSSLQPPIKHHKSENTRAGRRGEDKSDLLAGTSTDDNDFPVCSSTGYLLRHPVPSNNSCLFISVHFCLTGGVVDSQIGKSMRKIIAETVDSDKIHFDDAFLGKPNAEYCAWILDDNNWGGAIELSILCKYYETEIVAIDVKNMFMTRFGESSQYQKRMLLLYDGLHYDPLKFQPLDENQKILTLFSVENTEVLSLAEDLAKEARQAHQFTDLNALTLKCSVCNVELNQKTASEHAAKTGHVSFTELDKQ